MKDKYSQSKIYLLHPKARQLFTDFINECEDTLNIVLRITQGLRTILEQDNLYAQGRTTAGIKVTNAKGGQSFHNFGLAIDLAEMVDEDLHIDWNFDMSKLKPIADKYGIEWGGTWYHIKDKPHFELRFGLKEDCSDALAMVKEGKVDENGYILI